jgi:hypothetical protein
LKDEADRVTGELDLGTADDPYIVHSTHWVNSVFISDTSTRGNDFVTLALNGQNAWLTQGEAAELGLELLKMAGRMLARRPR